MGKPIQAYDHPTFLVQQERTGTVVAAATSDARFMHFQKARIRGVHSRVRVAGTATATPDDATIRWELYGPGGTTSFAAHFYGTQSVQWVTHSTVTQTVAANNSVRAVKLNDATGIVDVYYEYEVMPDAALS